jgi:hypothetical protein
MGEGGSRQMASGDGLVAQRASITHPYLVPPKVGRLAVLSGPLALLNWLAAGGTQCHVWGLWCCQHQPTVHSCLSHRFSTSMGICLQYTT